MCPECGEAQRDRQECPACPANPHGIGLKVLPPTPGAALGEAQTKLIRQRKMSTVDRLAEDPRVENLPDNMREVEQALDQGDLDSADRILEAALGTVLQGPGHDKRAAAGGFLSVALWVWCGILAVLLILSLFL